MLACTAFNPCFEVPRSRYAFVPALLTLPGLIDGVRSLFPALPLDDLGYGLVRTINAPPVVGDAERLWVCSVQNHMQMSVLRIAMQGTDCLMID